jgi:hypothetical protein
MVGEDTNHQRKYNNKSLPSATYSYIIDTNNNYKTAYYQSNDDATQKEEFIYDNLNRCIKINEFIKQPIVYINDTDRSIYKTEFKIIPMTENYEYNKDGTLFQVTEIVAKKITKIRRHYYRKY